MGSEEPEIARVLRTILLLVIVVGWGIALVEYVFQVPRDRIGSAAEQRYVSMASRTFHASASGEKGFAMNAMPSSRTPCCAIALSAYPDM